VQRHHPLAPKSLHSSTTTSTTCITMATLLHLKSFDAHKEDYVWRLRSNNIANDRRLRKVSQLCASGAFVLSHDKDAFTQLLTQIWVDVVTRVFIPFPHNLIQLRERCRRLGMFATAIPKWHMLMCAEHIYRCEPTSSELSTNGAP